MKEINRIAKIANESSITNDASLREQDEALQAFFRGWFDMNKSSQKPMLTEEEFQQAIKTEPIPPGFDPSYKAYKERIKNNIAEHNSLLCKCSAHRHFLLHNFNNQNNKSAKH